MKKQILMVSNYCGPLVITSSSLQNTKEAVLKLDLTYHPKDIDSSALSLEELQ